MDLEFIMNIFPTLLQRLPLTIYIVVVTAVLGFLLAVLVTTIRLKKIPVISQLMDLYTSFMRSTPGLIHIFIVYYGLPVLFRAVGIDINFVSRVTFSITALVLYNGAFVSEILRPSYLAVPREQHEAATSVGMTNWQKHLRVIFPQVLPIALPSLGNALIDLLKDTSLLFLIGLVDIMGQADIIIANSLGVYQLEVYVTIALIYWGCSVLLEQLIRFLEKKTGKYIR